MKFEAVSEFSNFLKILSSTPAMFPMAENMIYLFEIQSHLPFPYLLFPYVGGIVLIMVSNHN